MDLVEEVGESSSPPRTYSIVGGSGGGGHDVIRNDVFTLLIENGNEELAGNPHFREQLEAHFNRLPQSYMLDVNIDRVEDVLLHQKLLSRAKDSAKLPVFHIRCLEDFCSRTDDIDDKQVSSFPPASNRRGTVDDKEVKKSSSRRNIVGGFETCSKLEDLNLDSGRILMIRTRKLQQNILPEGRKLCTHQFMK